MQGKWNMKISGLPIDGVNYPLIEIFFNLGSSPVEDDILDFGTCPNFGYDLQIRLNAIGNNYSFLAASKQNYPTGERIEFAQKTVEDDRFSLQQTIGVSSIDSWLSTYQNIYLKNTNYEIATAYNAISGFVGVGDGVSPLILLHDLFSDSILYFYSSTGTGGQYQNGSVFASGENNKIVYSLDGFSITNQLPIVVDNVYGNVGLRVKGAISNILTPISPTDSDPYNPNNTHAGGDGETQPTDEMADETLPTISAADTGFVTLYKPSISQMNALANYMWGTLDIDSFKKIFANPMDVILGLSILPGIVPSGGSSSVKVGNIDTGVSMTKVGNQYVKFNCGSVTIKRKWGAFLDYSPYTKAFIYLPFIGVHPIDVDEIMNKSVSVSYNIDVLSGGCCAFVKVDGTTLYSYIGQCACSVPVTGKDWSTMINGVLGAVSGVAGTIGSIASGNVAGAISGIASVAQNVAGAKPSYQRSGTMGGMGGMMGIKTPYIIIERPVQAVPGYQNQIIGYPSFITRMIGDFRGYTEIEQCHLENIPCMGDEMIEIENILKTGVIL